MKKVLLAGAALMLVGGIASTASAAAVEPGVKITGDARVRLWYQNDNYGDWGNDNNDGANTDMDSRVRLNVSGTAAGGAYAKARIRLMEGLMGNSDTDTYPGNSDNNSNIWVDKAYVGIPFNDMFTLEAGKWRSTYGPLPTTYNFFYDDVNLSGLRGIVKVGDVEINPFIEWMDEAQNSLYSPTTNDKYKDNDEIRYGAHVKAKLNKDWTVGGMLGYQMDERDETATINANDGFFGSVYTTGKSGQIGFTGELAVTSKNLNGFNSFLEDTNSDTYSYSTTKSTLTKSTTSDDAIGSEDTGFGGYILPSYTMDKLTLGLNVGFTQNGFMPDTAFGFVMIGGADNSKLSAVTLGSTGDWIWGGLVATYQINESLKLTGNIVYADVDPWTEAGDGPGFTKSIASSSSTVALDSAMEISAVLQYTISKGADIYFSMGYLDPSLTYINPTSASLEDDPAFGALTRFELTF